MRGWGVFKSSMKNITAWWNHVPQTCQNNFRGERIHLSHPTRPLTIELPPALRYQTEDARGGTAEGCASEPRRGGREVEDGGGEINRQGKRRPPSPAER